VDGIWPRGVSKQQAAIDEWLKSVAPTKELRKWFGHKAEKWDEFKKRYFKELENKKGLLEDIRKRAKGSRVTLIYAAKDENYNNAVALKEYIEKKMK
jgi:uncharacterized protein YeaO (DUF488 family)